MAGTKAAAKKKRTDTTAADAAHFLKKFQDKDKDGGRKKRATAVAAGTAIKGALTSNIRKKSTGAKKGASSPKKAKKAKA